MIVLQGYHTLSIRKNSIARSRVFFRILIYDQVIVKESYRVDHSHHSHNLPCTVNPFSPATGVMPSSINGTAFPMQPHSLGSSVYTWIISPAELCCCSLLA